MHVYKCDLFFNHCDIKIEIVTLQILNNILIDNFVTIFGYGNIVNMKLNQQTNSTFIKTKRNLISERISLEKTCLPTSQNLTI